jgi:hypothetical protein
MKFNKLMTLSLATALFALQAGNLLAAGGEKSETRQRMEDTGRDIQDSSRRTYDEATDDATGAGEEFEGEQRQQDSEMGKLRGTGRDIIDSTKRTGRELRDDVRGLGRGSEDAN